MKQNKGVRTHTFNILKIRTTLLFNSTTTQRHARHSTDTVSEFHAKTPEATASEEMPKVPTWRLERDSNLRFFGRKAWNLPMSHHAPCSSHRILILQVNENYKYTVLIITTYGISPDMFSVRKQTNIIIIVRYAEMGVTRREMVNRRGGLY